MAKQTKKVKSPILPSEVLDAKIEAGEDVADQFDFDAATKRFNLDMPIWALKELDREAQRRGIARQALVRNWVIDRLDELRAAKAQRKAETV